MQLFSENMENGRGCLMKKLLKKVIVIMMALSFVLGTIQPMYVSAEEIIHAEHEECSHVSGKIVIMGHNCNDYFDVVMERVDITIVGSASLCKYYTYAHIWRCTFPGCKVVENHGYSYHNITTHDFNSTTKKCNDCGYSK